MEQSNRQPAAKEPFTDGQDQPVRKKAKANITRRWLLNNLGVSAIVLVVVAMTLSLIISFY